MARRVIVAVVFDTEDSQRWFARVIIGADGSRAMDGLLNRVVTLEPLQEQVSLFRAPNQKEHSDGSIKQVRDHGCVGNVP